MIAVARLLRFSRVPGGAREAAALATSVGLADGDSQALFGFVRRLGLSDAQADDAVQETAIAGPIRAEWVHDWSSAIACR